MVVSLVMFSNLLVENGSTESESIPGNPSKITYKNFPNVTFMVRTSAKPNLVEQFYCVLLRMTVLFWPAAYGKVVVVLDAESKPNRAFGNILLNQMRKYFPEYEMNVFFEPIPKMIRSLDYVERSVGYTAQLYSTFIADLYTKDKIISYMDTDSLILTPITKQVLFKEGKLKVLGFDFTNNNVPFWKITTEKAIGLPMIANFMEHFPQLIYRETYAKCRKHMFKMFNTTDLIEILALLYRSSQRVSPYNIIMHYAWYFERDRYYWHLKIGQELVNSRNRVVPKGFEIQPRDVQPAFIAILHGYKKWQREPVIPGYCASLAFQGYNTTECTEQLCDTADTAYESCKSGKRCCTRVTGEHFRDVYQLLKSNIHSVNVSKAEQVERLAASMNATCEQLNFPKIHH